MKGQKVVHHRKYLALSTLLLLPQITLQFFELLFIYHGFDWKDSDDWEVLCSVSSSENNEKYYFILANGAKVDAGEVKKLIRLWMTG